MNTKLSNAPEHTSHNPLFKLLPSLYIALIFLLSGISKFQSPLDTLNVIQSIKIIPNVSSLLFVALLPAIEILLSIFILLNIGTRLCAMLSAFLFSLFTLIHIYILWNRIDLSCGCFGQLVDVKSHWFYVGMCSVGVASSLFLLKTATPPFDAEAVKATA